MLPALLIITENPSIRFWVKKHLDNRFFILDATEKGEALTVVLDFPLNFIILDSNFEDCDALELCQKIRATPLNITTPIFLITGRLKKNFREKATLAGVTDFLSDQLDIEELMARIDEGLKANALREKTSSLFTHAKIEHEGQKPASLKNRVVQEKEAAQIFAKGRKDKRPSSMLVLRIDDFIHFESGLKEEILPLFSKFLSRCTSQKDLTVPLKEGKFTVLLPDTQIDRAKKIVEVLHKELEHYLFKTKKGTINLSASIALSKVDGSEKSFDELIDLANQAFMRDPKTKHLTISLDQGPV